MAGLGFICLVLALAVCAYGIAASIYGVRSHRWEFADSGRRAMYALAAVLTVAGLVLEVAFLSNDFAFNTVADTSSRTTPTLYRVADRVVLAGRVTAAVGLAAFDLVQPGVAADPQAAA